MLQKSDGTLVPFKEVHETELELTEQRSWFTEPDKEITELSCEVSISPEDGEKLYRFVKQYVLDDLVNLLRRARSYGHVRGHWEIAKEQYDRVSAIAHRLHGMNLTRYLRSACPWYTARGIRVCLPSGHFVWKK